jgi:hypothetical protein
VQEINITVDCPECNEKLQVFLNTFTAEHYVKRLVKPANYFQLLEVVEHYKAIKGFDKFPTWDSTHKPRAMKAAKMLLRFFKRLEDPLGVAKECISEKGEEFSAKGLSWSLETIFQHAPEWLLRKVKVDEKKH